MGSKLFYIAALVIAASSSLAEAQSGEKNRSSISLVEAYNERVNPGIPQGRVRNNQRIVIVWKSVRKPTGFFWNSDSSTVECGVAKAYKNANRRFSSSGAPYSTEPVELTNIKKGDTLMLSPIPDKRMAMPANIGKMTNNTIYYHDGGNKWLRYAVKKLGNHVINMP